MITFDCPCGRQVTLRDEDAGQRTRCLGCGRILDVPGTGGAAVRRTVDRSTRDTIKVFLWITLVLSGTLVVLLPIAGAFAEAKRGRPAIEMPSLGPPAACICFVLSLVGLAVSYQRDE